MTFGRAEVRDREREHHERGADEPVAAAGQGDGEEDAEPARAQRHRRLVQAGVGDGQRSDQDDDGVRQGEEHLRDDDADGAVDGVPEQQLLDEPLGAEEVDQRDARQQGRHQDRDHRDRLEQPLERDAAPGERVGEREPDGDGDERRDRRHLEAVPDRPGEGGGREVVDVVGEPHERAVVVAHALRHHRVERHREGDDEVEADDADEGAHRPVVAADLRPDGRGGEHGVSHGGACRLPCVPRRALPPAMLFVRARRTAGRTAPERRGRVQPSGGAPA